MIFAVIGGDARQPALAEALSRKGHELRVFALGNQEAKSPYTRTRSIRDAAHGADCVILPLPVERPTGRLYTPLDGGAYDIEEALQELESADCAVILAGNVTPALRKRAEEAGLELTDYYEREELKIYNAAITAEAALASVMGRSGRTVMGESCLVTGGGRVARQLVSKLAALGARVTVAARGAADRAWMHTNGCKAAEMERVAEMVGEAGIIFNTVPAEIFSADTLARARHGALYVELASEPYGADLEEVKAAGLNYISALSLPGRYSPVSAGECISDTVCGILKGMGIYRDE